MNMNSGNSWTATTLAGAKTANSYFQFSVVPVTQNRISLASLEITAYQQNVHAGATVVVEYSTNGFLTAGVAIGTNNAVGIGWNGSGYSIALSNISALQNVTNPITFRLWGYGFSGYEDKGLGQIVGNNDDVLVVGTVTSPAATPVFDPPSGSFGTTQTVTITSATPGATIRYTTDGSTPSASVGTIYSGLLTVATNTTLKAIAYRSGYLDSAVATANYTIVLPVTVQFQLIDGSLHLNWAQGTLLEADEITGPWRTNGSHAPFIITPTGPKKFYRVQVQ
jgi:hypothetical protein